MVRALSDYKVIYKNETYYVDRNNVEDVAYLFNVLLHDPKYKIYLCYSNGDKYEICLKEAVKEDPGMEYYCYDDEDK